VVQPGTDSPPYDPQPDRAPVVLSRTARGWSVVSARGELHTAGLVEGLCLADLVAEEFGPLAEPDRSARRSARGAADAPADDTVDARVAALERTVAQLEHALAARVSTERAIGVLAERQAISPRAAFESLRRDARSQGRPVAELAREVLDSLQPDATTAVATPADVTSADVTSPAAAAAVQPAPAVPPVPRSGPSGPPAVAAADGRS
jgi:hypothetical protein